VIPHGTMEMARAVQGIRAIRLPAPAGTEAAIVDLIADAMVADGHTVRREVRLPRVAGRVDLWVDDGLVVEVKRGKPNTARVRHQVARYAAHPRVRGVILVSERGLLGMSDCHVEGTPVAYVALSVAWGVVT